MNIKVCSLADFPNSEELFECRFDVFAKRLHWNVPSSGNREFDEYDHGKAKYIVIEEDKEILASVRLIDTRYPNLFSGAFRPYYRKHHDATIEATRFFVMKNMSNSVRPLCQCLFLRMIDYCIEYGHRKITAVVGQGMARILLKYGWNYEIVEQSYIEGKPTYLINLPTTPVAYTNIMERMKANNKYSDVSALH